MENLKLDESEVSPNRPNLTFLPGSFSLAEVIRTHPMPVVVKFDCERQPIAFNQFNFDLSQPLLLYRRRNIQKVPARSLAIHAGMYVEVGEPLLIPEDYKGWFAVLQRWMGNSKADTSEPHFTTIEELANSNTDRFLVGGANQINALHVLDRSEGHLNHQQRQFLPGDTLTRVKIYFGETKKKTRLFRKPKYITAKFLLCHDDSDREILLPFEQKGIFYQISERSGKPNRNVLQMSDVVARNLHPRILKLVFGRFPVTPTPFTGLLKAESVMLESSVIAATIQNEKNILMEIPLLDEMFFRVAVLDDDLKKNDCYRNAMNLCSEKVTTYMRNIKICYNFADADVVDVNENPTPVLRKRQNPDNAVTAEQFLNIVPFNDVQNPTNKLQSSLSVGISSASLSPLNRRYDKFNRPRSYGLKSYYKLTAHHEVLTGTKPKTKTEDNKRDVSRSPKVKRATIMKQTRMSEDAATLPMIRPVRSISTSRMSLCLGNSYLTVPLYASDLISPKEEESEHEGSMDNSPTEQGTEHQRRLSRISFDGRFFNEEEDTAAQTQAPTNTTQGDTVPPPMSRTNIDSYVKLGQTPTIEVTEPFEIETRTVNNDSTSTDMTLPVSNAALDTGPDHTETHRNNNASTNRNTNCNDKYEDVVSPLASFLSDDATPYSGKHGDITDCNPAPCRHSVRPPEAASPPVPSYRDSRTSSGFSSASRSPASSTCDDALLGRNSADLNTYDVPKVHETAAVLSYLHESIDGTESGVLIPCRKQSTFTFSEGCPQEAKILEGQPIAEIDTVNDTTHVDADGEHDTADPVYVNLKALMEFVSNLDCQETETENSAVEKDYDNCNNNIEGNIAQGALIIQTEGNDVAANIFKDDNKCVVNIDKDIDDFNKSVSDIGFDNSIKNTPPPKPAKPMSFKVRHGRDSANAMHSGLRRVSDRDTSIWHSTPVSRSKSDETSMKASYSCVKPVLRSCSEYTTIEDYCQELALTDMSVEQLVGKLKTLGIKETAVRWIRENRIDGKTMSTVINGEVDLKDCLKGVRLVDQQKISMYIRGWRPND